MFKSIFCKEFYKIRWLWSLLLLMNIGISIYVLINTRRLFLLDHPEIVWYRVIHLGQIYFDNFRFLPFFSGLFIACFQFLPEMWGERLKLSLHLPISAPRLVFYHILVGIVALSLALLPVMLFLWSITTFYFPPQMIFTVLITTLPWFMAGVVVYLGGSLVLLEPNLRLKAFNIIISASVAGIYLFDTAPGAYKHSFSFLILPLILMSLSVLYPAFRFRYRRTD